MQVQFWKMNKQKATDLVDYKKTLQYNLWVCIHTYITICVSSLSHRTHVKTEQGGGKVWLVNLTIQHTVKGSRHTASAKFMNHDDPNWGFKTKTRGKFIWGVRTRETHIHHLWIVLERETEKERDRRGGGSWGVTTNKGRWCGRGRYHVQLLLKPLKT